jgi:hypothetical protein
MPPIPKFISPLLREIPLNISSSSNYFLPVDKSKTDEIVIKIQELPRFVKFNYSDYEF